MKKILPYIYLTIGVFILVGTLSLFFKDKESYRVLLNFKTENRYIFLTVRLLFATWFLTDGIRKLKQNQQV